MEDGVDAMTVKFIFKEFRPYKKPNRHVEFYRNIKYTGSKFEDYPFNQCCDLCDDYAHRENFLVHHVRTKDIFLVGPCCITKCRPASLSSEAPQEKVFSAKLIRKPLLKQTIDLDEIISIYESDGYFEENNKRNDIVSLDATLYEIFYRERRKRLKKEKKNSQ